MHTPDLFRAEGRETVDARAREIQKAVRVKILERFSLEARDEAAARWLRIPEDLRRG